MVQSFLQKTVDAYALGRYAEAMGHLQRCLDLDPSSEAAWQYKALCSEAMGLKEQMKTAAR